MSDPLRKNFSDKLEEKIVPDSQKTTLEKGKEAITNAADSFAKDVTPREQKSVSQQAGDVAHDAKKDISNAGNSVSSKTNSDIKTAEADAKKEGEGLLAQAEAQFTHLTGGKDFETVQKEVSESAKAALDAAGGYVQQASEYVQEKLGGGHPPGGQPPTTGQPPKQ